MLRLWLTLGAVLAVAASATAPVVWKLDSLKSIGGHAAEVLGAPSMVEGTASEPALHFNGESDGVILPVNPIAGWSRFTIEALFLPDTDGPSEQRFVHLADIDQRRVLLETRNPDATSWTLDTFLRGQKDDCTLRDMTKLHPPGQWAWVALVYDGRTMSHYVNGVKELEAPVRFEPMTSGRTSIGVRLDRQYWFKGSIREIRFHPTALIPEALQRY
jgi:hypothetical protein